MRPTRLRGIATGLTCAALLVASGCGEDTEPDTLPSEPSTTETNSAPSPSEPTETTEQPQTDRQKAIADAESVVRDFKAFQDELGADVELSADGLTRYLQDPELTAQRDFRQRFRDQGFYTDGGRTRFDWMRVTNVQIVEKKRRAQVSVTACYNLDDVQAFYKDGKPVNAISPGLAYYQVFNYDYPSSAGWKIAVEDIPGKRCKS